ncbi:uncharacterized protein LOC102653954 [Apis mellifera]|uniref:Uncharacterized protein LOC102653954 n=1 Tax=Apis mellifera TaxID=7460 RepID=A0A7M7IIZ6_APIME|nr:uncharacterized protein LOC102653954 [Apis mellifera]|eukprot:XP_016766646.1 uncharacterized protein LOC102653954 [Apis mellifera]
MVLPPETGWVPGEKFKFILSTGPLLPGYRGVIYEHSRPRNKDYYNRKNVVELVQTISQKEGEIESEIERERQCEKRKERNEIKVVEKLYAVSMIQMCEQACKGRLMG